MRWLDKLERHFGAFGIPNLIIGVILAQAIATLLAMSDKSIPLLLMLDPAAVEAGQWYRLFTWVIVPSVSPLGVIFAIFYFQLLFMIGQSLEAEWGAFKSTVYLVLGVLLPSVGSMFLWHFYHVPVFMTGWYFSTSLMLAFAALAPEFTLLLMFILPVKMRWWAWLVGAYLLFKAVTGGLTGFLEVGFGVGNYLIYFLPAGVQAWRQGQSNLKHRKVFKAAEREAVQVQLRRCETCGKGPAESDLRLCHCDQCGDEGRNYCTDHLPQHLAKPLPEKLGKPARVKQKRKS